jgi:hypothetical protein
MPEITLMTFAPKRMVKNVKNRMAEQHWEVCRIYRKMLKGQREVYRGIKHRDKSDRFQTDSFGLFRNRDVSTDDIDGSEDQLESNWSPI